MKPTAAANFTAVELLHAFLEMRRLHPNVKQWSEASFPPGSSGAARLQQLMARFRAFGIPWQPHGFLQGDFIKDQDPRYAGIVTRLQSEMESAKIRMPVQMRGGLARQLPGFFEQLLKYRSHFEKALSHNDGVGEASGLYLLAWRKVYEMNQVIRNDLRVLDQTLGTLISPEGREFTRNELMERYGYPDVDVRVLDANEW